MAEPKKKTGNEEPAKEDSPQPIESEPATKRHEFDLSVISRLASQISDDGKRKEKKKDHGN